MRAVSKAGPWVPSSSYRLQLNSRFTFKDAKRAAEYLASLGVAALYSSPLLKARAGSSHCYDVVDHNRLNEEIGSSAEFDSLVKALRQRRMGLILDIVPNHMGISQENAPWMDVLQYGPFSRFARFFDVDWSGHHAFLKNRVLLPVLREEYQTVLRTGGLALEFSAETARFSVRVQGGLSVPLTPSSLVSVLERGLSELNEADWEAARDLRSLVRDLGEMPSPRSRPERETDGPNLRGERQRIVLESLCDRSPQVGRVISETVAAMNASVVSLDSLLRKQFFWLASWRTAAKEINYRRFLNVNDLIAVRVEDDAVFEASHNLVLNLVRKGDVTGLRIDHPDGLRDPGGYFRRLQRGLSGPPFASRPFYVVAEKILRSGERLPARWAVCGTTGYDFMNLVNSLFVLPTSEEEVRRAYAGFIGRDVVFSDVAYAARILVMRRTMLSELDALARLLKTSPGGSGPSLGMVTKAVEETAACFSCYRTYFAPRSRRLARDEAGFAREAIEEAESRNRNLDPSAWVLLRKALLEAPQANKEFAMRFQQFTSAIQVKGVEDTALYRYNILASLNEVGGEPERFGISIDDFHRANRMRARRWPHSMLATSTHDTKRGEDVRARINVISEVPSEWRVAAGRWHRLNERHKTVVDGRLAPSRNAEYLLYQTLLGAMPFEGFGAEFTERMVSYMLKASKEEKQRTSWLDPDAEYDAALERFIRAILDRRRSPRFVNDLLVLQRKVAFFGLLNSLSQLLLKLTCPGVPDIYQGSELWELNLVDPDNRREVDFSQRASMLRSLSNRTKSKRALGSLAVDLLKHPQDGLVKMFMLHLALLYRRRHVKLFSDGAYLPVECVGPKKEHVVAFVRETAGERCLVVTARFFVGLVEAPRLPVGRDVWRDTCLIVKNDCQHYRNVFTDEIVQGRPFGKGLRFDLEEVMGSFPFALLDGGRSRQPTVSSATGRALAHPPGPASHNSPPLSNDILCP